MKILKDLLQMFTNKKPLVVVLGATGTGKSKLSLQIAEKYNGEIISADSMQVYKGLDIVTNKVTAEDRNLVQHHLLDFLQPPKSFTVVEFRNAALQIINTLHNAGKVPVIVGGTHYYIESLIWNVLIGDKVEDDTESMSIKESNEELLEKLKNVDPEMAKRHHPNERRKIIRSLQVFEQTGLPHSWHIQQQKQETGAQLGGAVRFPNTAVFWMMCEQDLLDERLDARVNEMINQGLLKELSEFQERINYHQLKVYKDPKEHYTKGIFQSIGFKEFHEFLMLDDKTSEKANKLYKQAVINMKQRTRKYSRYQVKWIRNRFLKRDRQRVPLFGLDGTNVAEWHFNVWQKADAIVEALLNDKSEPYEPLPLLETNGTQLDHSCHHCETCNIYLKGEEQLKAHMIGRKHKKRLKGRKDVRGEKIRQVKGKQEFVKKELKNYIGVDNNERKLKEKTEELFVEEIPTKKTKSQI